MRRKPALRDAVYGAAVGDALGVPYEFMGRGSFACEGMVSGGAHGQPAGTFSDDTSMIIATCDSIRACGRVDVDDMRKRFNNWLRNGAYTPGGDVFDVGNTVATALYEGAGCTGERSNGNGSLMRIAPLAFTDATDDEVRAASAITHAHEVSTEACVAYVGVLRKVIDGASIADAVANVRVGGRAFDPSISESEVRSGGYVLDTLNAALWCLANTGSYAECVLAAVNLGDDADTTACVAGALAGAYYGCAAIPAEWLDALRGKDVIERCLFGGAMYEELTALIPELDECATHGSWVIDRESAGTEDDPIRMPYVGYGDTALKVYDAIYGFVEEHPELCLTKYHAILEAAGLKWEAESMEGADASALDGRTVMALLLGALRADRFCEGAYLGLLESGAVGRWLRRLREIDEGR